jgi:hypothetical protein
MAEHQLLILRERVAAERGDREEMALAPARQLALADEARHLRHPAVLVPRLASPGRVELVEEVIAEDRRRAGPAVDEKSGALLLDLESRR